MEIFDSSGHLTDAAIQAVISQSGSLGELERLEIAEHLSYCDECLSRYTDMLTDGVLSSPPAPVSESVWRRIRLRAARLMSNRIATAAAAIVIVFALWGSGAFSGLVSGAEQAAEAQTSVSQSLDEGRSNINASVEAVRDGINNVFSIFSNDGASGNAGGRIQSGGMSK